MITNQQSYVAIAERLNRVRLARAQALFSPLQRQLFTLIPVLLHYHQPSLPGYIDTQTPVGITSFVLESAHREALQVCRLGNVDEQAATAACALEGVYVMGSTASFGQNPKSDVDVWLVYDADLSKCAVERLRQKTQQLTQWYAGFDFEVNFYLVHPQQFCRHQSMPVDDWDVLGHEHSGSAQHWLLLEEFYRSHLRLAGKTVAWWPGAEPSADLLYLGDVRQLPASEYFGASLWQLYKGLEKPHKALLKVLLLEAYASAYPQTVLISDLVWQKTLAGDFSTDNDPYLLLLQCIENYLCHIGDVRRLEIARRCFYLKCGICLSDPQRPQDWRFQLLRKRVRDWEWPYSQVVTLDNCASWHSGELQWFNAQLNELMLASYQTLLRFASKHQLSEHFRVEDLGLLTRKLHTYFSEDEQQILQLNPLWSQSLAEPQLTVVRSNRGQQSFLYRQGPDAKTVLGESAIHKAVNTAAVLAWACLNGVCNRYTQWAEFGRSAARGKRLTKAAQRLLPHLQQSHSVISKLDLCQPWYYRKVLVLLNLEQDPTVDWQGQGIMLDLLGSNVLSVGQQQLSLLGSIHLISLNSWGEWHCHSFHGELALLELIRSMAPGLRRGDNKVALDVVSVSKQVQPQLEQAISRLLQQWYRQIRSAGPSKTLVQPLLLRQKRYGLFFDVKGMSFSDLSDVKSLYQQLARTELQPSVTDNAPVDMPVPEEIQAFAVKGVLQYFLKTRDAFLDVFVLDEANQFSHYVQPDSDIAELVNQITQHYAFSDINNLRHRFNFPQFFILEQHEGKNRVLPFGLREGTAQSQF